jgi:hypothetical protein
VSAAAGAAAAAAFLAIAGLHAYWALGGFWPGRDADSLARTVVGGRPGMRGPGPAATWAVVIVLLGAAVTALAAGGLVALPIPGAWVHGAARLGALVLLLRGLEGFVDARLRPDTVGSPFARLNVVLYSPLCLALSLLTWAAAR